MNSRVLAVLAVVLLAICGVAVWVLNEQPAPALTALPSVEATPPPLPQTPRDKSRDKPLAASSDDESDEPEDAAPTGAPMGSAPGQPLAEWEKKIDQVLRTNADETQTAQMLITMLPTLPPEGQAEAAQHITNLVLDKDYARVIPLVKNPNLSEEVLDVLVTDLMNREDDVKLPVLLEIAKTPSHPHHEEAASDLEIFLDEDNGTDWGKWERTMKTYLKKQAEENAAAEKEDAIPGTKTGLR